ncbi:hypothetical protein EAE99_001075 [Botrytis elliptica]|nr:hypothetical protein EAE99_001075 [Botrytis elliptica]
MCGEYSSSTGFVGTLEGETQKFIQGSSLKALSDSGYLIKSHLALEPPSGVHTPLDMEYGTIVGRSSAAQITLGSKSTAAPRCTISQSCNAGSCRAGPSSCTPQATQHTILTFLLSQTSSALIFLYSSSPLECWPSSVI